MREIDEKQIRQRCMELNDTFVVYFYTPLCGTCGVAKKMLTVTYAMLPSLPLYESNINFAPTLAQEWQIESVPCLALIENGELVRKVYAMHSVPHIYKIVKPLINKIK
jgi:thioredoxin-like negative regulator of GroEL